MALPQMSAAADNREIIFNGLFVAVEPAALYGFDYENTTGLDLAYFGGQFNGNTVADGDVTLTDNATNYVVADRTTGVVSDSTANTNFNDTTNYLQLYIATTVTGSITAIVDYRQAYGDSGSAGAQPKVIQIACSDETTPLTTGVKVTFRMPYAMTLNSGNAGVRASLTTAQGAGSTFTVDIQESGSTILSTLLTIDNTEKTSVTATPVVISDTALADDAEIIIEVTQIGDGTAEGLKVSLIGT